MKKRLPGEKASTSATPDSKLRDGDLELQNHWCSHEETMYTIQVNHSTPKIMEHNAQLRKSFLNTSRAEIAGKRYFGEVPSDVMDRWRRTDPEMRTTDRQTHRDALVRHMILEPEVLVVPKSALGKKPGSGQQRPFAIITK